MTNIRFLIIQVVFCLTALILTACTKNVAGPKGEQGEAGKPGNLVETHSGNVTVSSSSWTFNADNNYWETLVFVKQITQNSLQQGEVKVYLKVDSLWWALPYGKDYVFTQAAYETGIVRLNYAHIHGGTPTRPSAQVYRVAVFEPAQ